MAAAFKPSPMEGRVPQRQNPVCRNGARFGDAIQYFRFLRYLPSDTKTVFVGTPPSLVRLFQQNASGLGERAQFLVPEKIPPADYTIPLCSLPIETGMVPSELYLRPMSPGYKIEKSPDHLAIGICWQGAPNHPVDCLRSAGLEEFCEELMQPGLELYSLQLLMQPQPMDPSLIGPLGLLNDLSPQIRDFADTAALIDQLDAVVTVDTSVAHLAAPWAKHLHHGPIQRP